MGRVYDYLEIHVKSGIGTYTEDIPFLMRKYGFSHPYQIKTIKNTPVKLMANIQHENGKLIKSPFPDNKALYREGTLGCFAENGTKKLYVLTCAHVVQNPDKEEHDVLIPDRGLKLRKIGKSTRRLTVCSGEGDMPLIDIAAVIVNEDFEKHCVRKMKDDSGLNRSAVIALETVPQLRKKFVYKHGAKSGLTTGMFCSSDFTLAGADGEEYTLLIEPLPGNVNGIFAEQGDSGAIICMPSIDNDSIKVVSMLNAGDYTLEGGAAEEKKCLSFLLRKGLEKLQNKSNILLAIP